MDKKEQKVEENPYKLSIEQLTAPGRGVNAWFDNLTKLQLEGIELGVRPQNPRFLPVKFRKVWRQQVWNVYLDTLSNKERLHIKKSPPEGPKLV